jgi:choline-sulfatase
MSSNFLIMMSDEHSRKVCGAYGNDIVQTPNLDRLAARGTIFANAYTPCPICVPARASFATGQPVHKTRHWDNAHAYAGEPESWAHQLAQAGRDVVSIGKLHYRSADDDLGFLESIEPLYLHGNGDILGCVREPLPVRWVTRNMAEKIGPGETTYTAYDRRIVEAAEKWLSEKGSAESDQPWTAFVSLVAPHFPLIAPQEYFDRYSDLELMPEKPADEDEHPWLQAFKACYIYDNFDDQKTHIALASYYALTTFMDDNVGKVLTALESSGMAENTTVIYVSDHGDNAGERGLWGKSNMYEESAGVPLILAGPGVPAGKVSHTPVTLMDIHPTALSLSGLKGDDQTGPSLVDLARADDDPTRVAFSEYHAAGAASAAYMIRKGRWKYIHYVGYSPQLFNLKTDPEELNDLGYSPDHADIRAELFGELTNICDPIVVDELAKADQRAKIELHGGREAVVGKGSFGATPAPT